MDSIHLIRRGLGLSESIVLGRIEEMREYAFVPPTPRGGCHTTWVLGHLAYIESLVVHQFAFGRVNPLAEWEELFDGDAVSHEPSDFPSFDVTLGMCREARAETKSLLAALDEADLEEVSRGVPAGAEDLFGTVRLCFQSCSDHWYMHRGQLADARRAAGLERMWL